MILIEPLLFSSSPKVLSIISTYDEVSSCAMSDVCPRTGLGAYLFITILTVGLNLVAPLETIPI